MSTGARLGTVAAASGTATAVRLHGPGDLRAVAEPVPVPAAGTSLVRVTALGICGSDLHWFCEGGIGETRLAGRPLVVGHEFAGVIEGGPRHGQRVAVDPAIPCHTCPSCREGWANLCPQVLFAGYDALDGGLRELLTWPDELLHPLPDELSDADGAMLEPLGVALHALDLGHLRVNGSVAVIGCGPIGLLLVQLARLAGAGTVVAVDPLSHRTAAALRHGADHALTPAQAGTDAWSTLVGRGVDVAFEVAGNDDAIALALLATRPGGRAVLVGIPDDDRISFPAGLARRKGLTLALSRRMNHVYPRVIDLVRRGRVDVASMVTERFGLADAHLAFESAARRDGLKVLIEPAR
ncbi:zinc-dependent alcohol dehydrogenase [Micromonospora sp. 067-2]|uniref:zinc-dependent alcohol dehydrogenase n=1 Tax=Micromonospora sp. 067-2 TaxID=2789270 RepID=UPI00397CB2E7